MFGTDNGAIVLVPVLGEYVSQSKKGLFRSLFLSACDRIEVNSVMFPSCLRV